MKPNDISAEMASSRTALSAIFRSISPESGASLLSLFFRSRMICLAGLVAAAGYLVLGGGVLSAVSQTAVQDEDEPRVPQEDRVQ